MSDLENEKPGLVDEKQAPLTSDALSEHVFDALLNHTHLLLASPEEQGISSAERFLRIIDVVNDIAVQAAKMGMANRSNLSAMPSFEGMIQPDADKDQGDQAYEIRYRMVETIGNEEKPFRDRVFTLDEAKAEFGQPFLMKYWGEFGEHTPKRLSASGDRKVWFTTVRYPVDSLAAKQHHENKADQGNKEDAFDNLVRRVGLN